MSLLSVKELAVSRGGLRVLDGVSFDLDAGQALVLRGPNGIGKTTVLRSIAGLQPPVSGSVSMAADSIAYAAHSDGLKTALSVTENLQFWSRLFGEGPIRQALAALDLQGLADRPAGTLSAGQKRRLGLARLLVTNRPIWILDEPTVSLDSASVQMFVAVLRAHLARGGAALMATHIDLSLPEGRELDLTPHRAGPETSGRPPAGFNEAFA